MVDSMRILVVEGDRDILSDVVGALRVGGHAVDTATDGDEGLLKATTWSYDAIVLDSVLPKIDGWTLIERLRRKKTVPCLMIVSNDGVSAKVSGPGAGADEYLIKPFEQTELRARLQAVIQRATEQSHPIIEINGIVVDTRSKQVTRKGAPVRLTQREYALVELLARHAGQSIPRTLIYEHLFGTTDDSFANLIEVHISNVRKKLGYEFITTRRGHGYLVRKRIASRRQAALAANTSEAVESAANS